MNLGNSEVVGRTPTGRLSIYFFNDICFLVNIGNIGSILDTFRQVDFDY